MTEPVDLAGKPTAKDLLPVPERRYIMEFFYQWEHTPTGDVFLHVYPGSVVNGQPVCQGQPVALRFMPDGLAALRGDVERGFQSPAVQTAQVLPNGELPNAPTMLVPKGGKRGRR